ncbi:MAG: ascorbate peroxidase [Monoraphidium minutum]|nr:MAG: ascorbate peroxidase [Monoraphidium minutum]
MQISVQSRSQLRAAPCQASRRRVVVARAATAQATGASEWKAQLKGARADVEALIRSTSSNPILVRLAWHDSGTFDKGVTAAWPAPGGATGSIRFKPEIGHGANAGLQGALDLVEPIKQKYPLVSYADLYQMASAVAIEIAGGPHIPLRYGRVDVDAPEDCAPEGRLPSAGHPFADGSKSPGEHLKKIFYRMGLDDKDIVVLSGAHTLGRSRPERSGWGKEETKYTKDGPGKPGGQSWTVNWLEFDNSYFKEVKAKRDADLLVLPTDAAVFEDEGFRPYAEKYAEDQAAFFADYVASHLKLSELGSKFEGGAGVTLE